MELVEGEREREKMKVGRIAGGRERDEKGGREGERELGIERRW